MHNSKTNSPLYSKDGKTLIRCPETFEGVFDIPRGTEAIGPKAFFECKNLLGVKIPNSVLVIDDAAFKGCFELAYVEFEKGSELASIGKYAFYGCKKIRKINIPEWVTEIEEHTFSNCTCLEAVTMPNNIAIIGEGAFMSCLSIESIILPENLLSIKSAAFIGCKKLKEIIIPDSVESLHAEAFALCDNLSKVLTGIDSHLQFIGKEAFRDCFLLRRVMLPQSLKTIEKHAFKNCDSLKSLFIPARIRSVDAEIAAMCNMDFTFFCEGEPGLDWNPQWNQMSGYNAPDESPIAPTVENVPRWWYERFAAPSKISPNLMRASSDSERFDKEKVKKFIAATNKPLYFQNGWGWSGAEREETTKEKMLETLDTFDCNDPEHPEDFFEVNEYEDAVLMSIFTGLPF